VMHFDKKGIIVDCNRKFLELLGTDRDSLINFDMLSSLRDPAMKAAVLKSLSGETGYFEGPYRSVTGDKLTSMRCLFSRIDSESGHFLGGLCIAEDVGDRMETEAALRQSEARYRAIVEAQTELVSRFTREGVLTFVNEAYCRYFGETRDELMGSMFWHHVPDEESRNNLREHIASLGPENPVAAIEHQVVTSDGEIRWQQWTDRAILDEEGNLLDIQAVGRDITERKKAELALQEAHQQLQDIIEFLPDATFVINKERKVIAWNRAIEEMTGLGKEDVLGRSDYAHAIPFYGENRPTLIDLVVEDNPEFEKLYDFVERRGNTIFGEVFVPKAYGGLGAYLWGTASPLFDATGQMIGAIQSIRDITERKNAEDAIHRSEKQLRFLSSRLLTAHEEERKRIARELHDSIGQSLAAVKFFVETTLKSAETEEAIEIVASLETLVPMIQNAMQEARRIYTGLRPSMLDDLGIVATIGWFCREFQLTYPMIHVQSRMGIQEEDVPENLKIVIFRVIQEAMNNIAKHSGAELAGLALLKVGDKLQLSIEDNGTGFDLDSVLGKHPHERGLGLTGMKERTELSDGVFTLHSLPGKGTTITAVWPCRN
ncbi:MAG: PAS domain S-box protein, partial [Syntrophobacteraceae bacterium]|nr:PAS domain S-box protein [Syntrophobacteraceae bacterium]